MAGSIITQDELKELLHYNPDTGIFTRPHSGRKVGSNFKGYLRIAITLNNKNSHYLAHRLAWLYMYGEFPNGLLDHINGVRNDNRIINLRIASDAQNQWNSGKKPNNTSGFKGVSRFLNGERWKAEICINKKRYYLGLFNSALEAKVAYDNFAKEYQGDFYRDSSHPTLEHTASAHDLIALKSTVVILHAASNVE